MTDTERLLALLYAPDVFVQRRRENNVFMVLPPLSLSDELAWQRRVEVRRQAEKARERILYNCKRRQSIPNVAWKEAKRLALEIYGPEQLEALLGRPLTRNVAFSRREAQKLRRAILEKLLKQGGKDA